MYINNTKKLFEDLKAIPTMESYMIDCVKADGDQDNLANLVSIVWYYHDALADSSTMFMGEVLSSEWNLAEYDEKGKKQLIKDNRALNNIWKILKKEATSPYVLICSHCCDVFFYGKKPKYEVSKYQCLCKKIGTLKMMEFNEWANDEILNIRRRYFKGK